MSESTMRADIGTTEVQIALPSNQPAEASALSTDEFARLQDSPISGQFSELFDSLDELRQLSLSRQWLELTAIFDQWLAYGLGDPCDTASEQLLTDVSTLRGLCQLASEAESASEFGDMIEADQIAQLLQDCFAVSFDAQDAERASAALAQAAASAREQWGDYLVLLNGSDPHLLALGSDDTRSDDYFDGLENNDTSPPDASPDQIGSLLALVSASPVAASVHTDRLPADESTSANVQASTKPPLNKSADDDVVLDEELLQAFLDDAGRCLATMQQLVLTAKDDQANDAMLRSFCRELHTLKGASASVGYSDLANYLHRVEDQLEAAVHQGKAVEISLLFEATDAVEARVASLAPSSSGQASEASARTYADNSQKTGSSSDLTTCSSSETSRPATPAFSAETSSSSRDVSVRVRASQLDRLMDLLAELVVIRNRRDNFSEQFAAIQNELIRCSARMQYCIELGTGSSQEAAAATPSPGVATNGWTELAADVGEIGRRLKVWHTPLCEENEKLSQFIRYFRQELMQLRRLPVSALFRRLQRAAIDAARTEAKSIEVVIIGEETGVEQSLQDQLFQPLMHLVRNAISHGIETPEERAAAGKSPRGTVTITAHCSINSLVLEIQDDGRGLNYDKIRHRAYQHGLLAPDDSVTEQQLAQMIFHSGFSTRESVNTVAGRGVGMDVVANTIERLHGRIEIESRPGRGCTMRVSVPLHSGIEHAMLVRAGNQLFALPAAQVTVLDEHQSMSGERTSLGTTEFGLSTLMGFGNQDAISSRRIQIGATGPRFRIDQIVGLDETVVRSLPALLRRHPLITGITVTGGGELAFWLDPQRLTACSSRVSIEDRSRPAENSIDQGVSQTGAADDASIAAHEDSGEATETRDNSPARAGLALVVDDSLSARKVLTKLLQQNNFETIEASDGLEALQRLNEHAFDCVFTDLDMPQMTGWELLADLQRRRFAQPVVVCSSRTDKATQQRLHNLGALGFIAKPVEHDQLQRALQQFTLTSS